MFKTFLFNMLILLGLGGVSYASDRVSSDLFGKEKPKSYFQDNELKNEKQLNSFSLRSDMQFRGKEVIKSQADYNYLNLNTSITYQKGNNNYVLPYRKNVILNRITFNPNANSNNRTYQR
ncbi:MAG: hypothetical protein IPH58_19760 [Sphingobacteriales bacterium]|jgi:hypothetical protein|nr:hypothetical protein [Sphingobacteriales bacterium]